MIVAARDRHGECDLRGLLAGLAVAPALPVRGIQDDSRRVNEGDVFFACQGVDHHGLEFAEAATAAGAAAVVWDSATGDPGRAAQQQARADVPFIAVAELAEKLGDVANRWYELPSHAIDVIGVTGTNGKTTVAYLVAQSLHKLATPAGYIGTLGFGLDELDVDTGLTTPPCLDLHAKLAALRDAGAGAAAIEVSSHALAQSRTSGVRFDTVVFTNLSRDHIDYHGSIQNYADAKARLFFEHESQHRIVSIDTDFGAALAARCGDSAIRTTTRPHGDVDKRSRYVAVRSRKTTELGSELTVETSWGSGSMPVPLPGDFNVSNALQVLAVLLARGVGLAQATQTVATLSAPPGRLERVQTTSRGTPKVYVDYAHTPAALQAVLSALRPHTDGRLFCVFGCGGDRDAGKRPVMGKVVARLADRAVITNDNPRSESPVGIIAAVAAGMSTPATVIEDRATAIAWAIGEAAPEDTVLIAGKGHEDYQIIGDQRIDLSDYQTAWACLDSQGVAVDGAQS